MDLVLLQPLPESKDTTDWVWMVATDLELTYQSQWLVSWLNNIVSLLEAEYH